MIFRDLPPEIQSRILELCSPSDLAVLSRVHTSGREMAEHALYSHIQYCVKSSDLMIPSCDAENGESLQELKEDRSLLHTLANNPQKASMVKMFYVKIEPEDQPFDEDIVYHDHRFCLKSTDFFLVKLAEALVKMSNLVDLGILHSPMDPWGAFEGTRRISEVIRGDYFKLHTLYLEYYQNLEEIVAGKPHLRLLGIHSSFDYDIPHIRKLHQDLSRCHTMPTVFTLGDLFEGPTITMHPFYHRPGEALRACREVSTSLAKRHGLFWKDRYHLSVSLIGTSEENISSLGELMEAMATCLQHYCPRDSAHFSVIIHEESIQKPWRFPEFVESLALFKDVRMLNIGFAGIDLEKWYQMATDLEFCMLKKLKHTWPNNVREIRFFCDHTADSLVMKCESNWEVIKRDSQLEPSEEIMEMVPDGESS